VKVDHTGKKFPLLAQNLLGNALCVPPVIIQNLMPAPLANPWALITMQIYFKQVASNLLCSAKKGLGQTPPTSNAFLVLLAKFPFKTDLFAFHAILRLTPH